MNGWCIRCGKERVLSGTGKVWCLNCTILGHIRQRQAFPWQGRVGRTQRRTWWRANMKKMSVAAKKEPDDAPRD